MIVISMIIFEVGNGSRHTRKSTWDDGYTAHPKIIVLLLYRKGSDLYYNRRKNKSHFRISSYDSTRIIYKNGL